MQEFISTETIVMLSLIRNDMPNLWKCILRCSTSDIHEKNEKREKLTLSPSQVLEAQEHHSNIVANAFRVIAAIHRVSLEMTKRLNRTKLQWENIEENVIESMIDHEKVNEMVDDGTDDAAPDFANDKKLDHNLTLLSSYEHELLTINDEFGKLLQSVDQLVAENELSWAKYHQQSTQNLVEQLKHSHGIILTQEEITELANDNPRSIVEKKEELKKVNISFAKKSTPQEIIVHYLLWQILSRSFKKSEEEARIFKTLAPYLEEVRRQHRKLTEEFKSKYEVTMEQIRAQEELAEKLERKFENAVSQILSYALSLPGNFDKQLAQQFSA